MLKIDIYRTDFHGTIVIKTNGQTYEVNQKHPYQYNPPKILEPRQSYAHKININTANVEQLQEIIHIGPVRAKEIIRLRPFDSIDDLVRVSGTRAD
ncbi:MAG: helix-hairpin-helix domain-containing protein [Dethiobacter sp.]